MRSIELSPGQAIGIGLAILLVVGGGLWGLSRATSGGTVAPKPVEMGVSKETPTVGPLDPPEADPARASAAQRQRQELLQSMKYTALKRRESN